MSAERRDIIKDLLLQLSESDPAARATLLANAKRDHPDLIDDLNALVPFIDAADEQLLGAEGSGRVPTHLGRFVVERLLGRGSMGEVYLATEPAPLGRHVAVKVIRSGAASRQARRRFEFEREVLTSLDHEHIAKVLDGGTNDDGSLFVAMEFVDGPPITRFASERRLSIEDRIHLVRQVCVGVAHAHLKGLVHRDLKPANVLVCERDGAPLAKIIDFGIAKLIGQGPSTMDTLPGAPLGTIEYMSPEQAQGLLGLVDQRSDIYSVGVMLYELLTGQLPRTRQAILESVGPRFLEQMAARRIAPPSSLLGLLHSAPPPSSMSSTRRRELDWIALRALEIDPERRYRSVTELSDDLGRFLGGLPVKAAPHSHAYRLKKTIRRYPWTTALGVLSACGAIAFTISPGPSQRATTPALELARASDRELALALEQAQRERDSAVKARDETKRAVSFLTSVLSGSSPMEKPQTATIAQVIDEANRRLVAEIPKTDAARLQLRKSLVQVLVYRGDFPAAIAQAEELASEATEIYGEMHFETGQAYIALGTAKSHAGNIAGAKSSFGRGIEILKSLDSSDARRVAAFAQMRLAAIAANEGDISGAIALCTPLVSAFDEQAPRHSNRLSVRWLLSHMLRVYGRGEDAVRYASEAAALIESGAVDSRPTDVANARHYLALARISFGGGASALADLDTAVAELTRWYGSGHHESLVLQIALCDAAADVGDVSPERIAQALATLDLATRQFSSEPGLIASARLSVGRLLLRADRLVEAGAVMKPALALDQPLPKSDAFVEASLKLELATALARLNRVDEAKGVLGSTPDRLASILPSNHPTVVRAARLRDSLTIRP